MDEIVKRILNSDEWPAIKNEENLNYLNEIADNCFNKNTLDGMLSATLIYHQIVESMCIHILECCYFFINLSLYPMPYSKNVEYDKNCGYYIKQLKESVDFVNKDTFLSNVQQFNSLRSKIVHEIRRTNIEDVVIQLTTIKNRFDIIYNLYTEIIDNFYLIFKDIRKDEFIDYE